MQFTLGLICSAILIKVIITQYKWSERYASFILTLAGMICLTERSLYLSPTEFKPDYIFLIFVGHQDYCNAQMIKTPQKHKKIFGRILWSYFLLRNYFYYGNISLLLVGEIVILISFQEKASELY